MHIRFPLRSVRIAGVLALAAGGLAARAEDKPAPAFNLMVDSKPIDRSAFDRVSYASVVRKASPSVVCVTSTRKVTMRGRRGMPFGDPDFRRFFNIPDDGGSGGNDGGGGGDGGTPRAPQDRGGRSPGRARQVPETGIGSGVIVSADGYIITNNHVVDGADTVTVTLGADRKDYEAKVVGRDPKADVAVIKIEASGLQPAVFGDSDQLQVGDVVLAVGDPFAVGLTVTHGIVSALERNGLNIEDYENFIQTDAPINPGNSGGALFDTDGRVVGINTAILSSGGGSSGVAFSIPSNQVRAIAVQLVATGKVARGYIGVKMEPLNADLKEVLGVTHGVLIDTVVADSPGDKAGLKSGDVLTKIDGRDIEDSSTFHNKVSEIAPGTSVTLGLVRDGKEQSVTLKLGSLPDDTVLADAGKPSKKDEGVLNGVTVDDISDDARAQYHIPQGVTGALVTNVDPDSASARARIAPGCVIEALWDRTTGNKPIHNADEAVKLSDRIKGPKVVVKLWRNGSSSFVVVDETK